MATTKRKPGEVSDVRSQNPGTKGVEGAKPFGSKAGYQIPTANESTGSPYKRKAGGKLYRAKGKNPALKAAAKLKAKPVTG